MGLFSMTQTASFAGKLFDHKTSTEPMIQLKSFKPSFSQYEGGPKLERCRPEDEGVPSALIHSFVEKMVQDRSLNMHNFFLMRNGKLLFEVAFGAQRLDVWKYTFSACKSVLSLAIGILIDDGVLHLNDRVIDMFSKETSAIGKLKLKDLTVEDLLTMRSPAQFSEIDSAVEEDWIRGYFSAPTKGEVGETFRYNSLNTYILSAILIRKSGMSLSDFLDVRLFSPLGVARNSWFWEKCPKEIEKGGWGLYLHPEDFGKIAQLVLQNGKWNEQQLISPEYLSAAISAQSIVTEESTLFDYGYQIWVGKHSNTFLFNGMFGQNVIGFKDNGIIAICNAGNGEFFHQSNYFRYVLEYFDRPFETTIPFDNKASKALEKYKNSLSAYSVPRRSLLNRLLKKQRNTDDKGFEHFEGVYFSCISGYPKSVGLLPLMLQAVENCYTKGFVSVSFETEGNEKILCYREDSITYRIPLGFGIPKSIELPFYENLFLVASQARIRSDEEDRLVLIVRLDFLEFPCSRILKFVLLDKETVLLKHEELPGKDFALETVRTHIGEFMDRPLLSTVMSRIGSDFFEFKAERCFAPELLLKQVVEPQEDVE